MDTRGAHSTQESRSQVVRIPAGAVTLEGLLDIPRDASGIVLFAHGSGSSRHSPRNRYVAQTLQQGGAATLLFDLLTAEEEQVDQRTAQLRFDIPLLAQRLVGVTDWLAAYPETRGLRIGYFGASTGAGAALLAAAERPDAIAAIVSRGGRPDLAGNALSQVRAPTLLIVGEFDAPVIAMNQDALRLLTVEKRIEIVPGATHLFEEPGALERVARLAREWFARFLSSGSAQPHARGEVDGPDAQP
ncbi:MAG TPA: dienelactone hydrolase family protein [Ktedonobacterales bacterium]